MANDRPADRVKHVRALHGWALLAARDSDTPEKATHFLAAVDALGYAVTALEDGWQPFDQEMMDSYAAVSVAVRDADSSYSGDKTDHSGVGVQ